MYEVSATIQLSANDDVVGDLIALVNSIGAPEFSLDTFSGGKIIVIPVDSGDAAFVARLMTYVVGKRPPQRLYGGTKQVVKDGAGLLDYIKSQTKG